MARRNRTGTVERQALFQQGVALAERRATQAADQGPEDLQPDTTGTPQVVSEAEALVTHGADTCVEAVSTLCDEANTEGTPESDRPEGCAADVHDMNARPGSGLIGYDALERIANPHARDLERIVLWTKRRHPERKYVPLSRLRPSPDQVREDYGDDEFAYLLATAMRYGVLQPISVRLPGRREAQDAYFLLDGHRRLRVFETLVQRAREWDQAHGAHVPYDPEIPVDLGQGISTVEAAEVTFNANDTALKPNLIERGRGLNKIEARMMADGDVPTIDDLSRASGMSAGAAHKYRLVGMRIHNVDLERALAQCEADRADASGEAPPPERRCLPGAVLRKLSIDHLERAAKLRDKDEGRFQVELRKAMENALRRVASAAAREQATENSATTRSDCKEGGLPSLKEATRAATLRPKRGAGPVDMQAIYESVREEGRFTAFRLAKKAGEYDVAQARRWIQTGAPAIVALAERVGEPAIVVQDAGPGSVIVVDQQPGAATEEEVRAATQVLSDVLRQHLDRARVLGVEDIVDAAKCVLGLNDSAADRDAA
jgi:hypothetical protein